MTFPRAVFSSLLCAASLSPIPAALAQPIGGLRLKTVEVRGSTVYSPADLTPLTGLKAGEVLEAGTLDAARTKLAETKLFAEVAYEYQMQGRDANVVFQVTDYNERYALRFDRLGKPDADLRALLKGKVPLYREPLPYAAPLVDQVVKALSAEVGAVATRVAGDPNKEQYLLVHPLGSPPVVADVRFVGAKVVATDLLVQTMRNAAVGVEYREELLREVLDQAIVPLYEARGRIRVKFPKIDALAAQGVKGYLVTFTIDEGPSYNFGEITIQAPDAAKRQANLKPGDLADSAEVKAAGERMTGYLKRGGYLDAGFKWDRKIDDTKLEAAISIDVTPGDQYLMGRVTYEGLDILSEPAIKKMWGIDPGKPYNPEYPDLFLQRIKEQRILDNLKETKADVRIDRKTHVVDVTLRFR